MASIADLSKKPQFSIKTVCDQTGIQAVTLRAWERRHEVLNPQRSQNRYRLYSEQDIAILRWIKKRLDDGIAISSAVNELREMQRQGILPEAVTDIYRREPHRHPTMPPGFYTLELYNALVKHDEAKAGRLMDEIQTSFPLITLLNEIYTPCLVKIGEAWYRDEIRVSTEHFASNFIKGKLLAIFQNLPSRHKAPSIIIGCAPNEQHELGSLMLAILLRGDGFRVESLGPDIPLDDLADYARYEKPQLIILAASMEESAQGLIRFQEKLSKIHPAPVFGYGGRAFVQKPQLIQHIPGLYLGNCLEEAQQKISQLLKKK
jgi:methanogenic corrinoid protein MtbC1